MTLRTIRPSERDDVLDLLHGWLGDRSFFARYFAHDPSFRDDLCFVAVEGERPVSTLQVFRKSVRVDGAVLDVGGVGNVYTDPAHRGSGLASELLRLACDAMREQGFDMSLLFASLVDFYARLGWRSHVRCLGFLEPGGGVPPPAVEIRAFDAARHLDAVMRIYDAQSAALAGTTVRDRAYWEGQLRYAGNPGETAVVALEGDSVVAYARGTTLYDFHVVLEYGCLDGRAGELADLVAHLHGGAAHLPGTLIQPAVPDLGGELRRRGLDLRVIEDHMWMWRVIDAERLAAKLGIAPADTRRDDFLARLFPPERSVYWFSDRF